MVDKTTQGAMDTVKVDDMTADERANPDHRRRPEGCPGGSKAGQDQERSHCGPGPDLCYGKERAVQYEDQCRQAEQGCSIDPKDLENILKPLDTTIDSLKGSLDDSFLSQETITSLVNKLATDVPASTAPWRPASKS